MTAGYSPKVLRGACGAEHKGGTMSRVWRAITLVAGAGVVALVGVPQAVATAQTTRHGLGLRLSSSTRAAGQTAQRPGGHSALAPTVSVTTVKDKSFAGYISEKTGIKTVSTRFEVPQITKCPATGNSGFGPVAIVVGSNNYFVGAGAEAACQSGVKTYQLAINYNGSEKKFIGVKPEDIVFVSITVSSTKTAVHIENLTTKHSISQQVPAGHVTAVELGDDTLTQGTTQLPVPPFSHHLFNHAKVNGYPLSKATPLFDEELVKNTIVLIKASALTSLGTAFTMTYH